MSFEFQIPECRIDEKIEQLRLRLAREFPAVPSVERSRFVMASHLANKVILQQKCTTIRFDKSAVEYPAGSVLPLYSVEEGQCRTEARCLANLVLHSVRYERVDALTENDAVADGFSSRDELMDMLEGFYGPLRPRDVVCIYAFSVARAEPAAHRVPSAMASL